MGAVRWGHGLALAGSLISLVGAPPAHAESDLCKAVALADAPGWVGENRTAPPDIVIHKGETYDEISMYQEDPTGTASFCQHGGGCVDRYVMRDGHKTEALRLQNCSIRRSALPSRYGGAPDFELVLDRSKVDATTIRYHDVDDRLLQLGMCNACADNAADEYVNHPESACSQAVRRALEGNQEAAESLSSLGEGNPCAHALGEASSKEDVQLSSAVAEAPTPSPNMAQVSMTRRGYRASTKIAVLILFGVLAAAIYFVPTIVAATRHKRNTPAIFALNLFLGWTFLGWVASLVWSVAKDDSSYIAADLLKSAPELPD